MTRPFPTDEQINAINEAVTPDALEHMALSGMFCQEISAGGKAAQMLVYLPEKLPHGCCSVFVLMPAGCGAEAFLEKAGWIVLADREKFAVLGLELPEGAEDALELATAARDTMLDRKYYNLGKTLVYVAAYGAAAKTAEQLILKSPSKLAGLAVMGQGGCSAAELRALGKAPSLVKSVKMSEVACPLSIFTDKLSAENRAAINFFIKTNKLERSPYRRDGMRYYMPDRIYDDNWVNSENTAPVAVMVKKDLDVCSPQVTERAWAELSKYFRPLDYRNTSTHPRRTPSQWGLERREMAVDGWKRSWEEFVPAGYKKSRSRRFPLVIDLHGGSGTPSLELGQGSWVRTAKARDLFLAVPHGSLRLFTNGTLTHPAWNANGKSSKQDDIKFIKLLIEDMCSRFPIDRTRIYITGHSMGSAMTQQLILEMPEVFAAAASNGGVIRPGFFGGFARGEGKTAKIPVIIQLGQFDRGGGTFKENPDALKTVEYWIKRNDAGNVNKPAEYVNGPFRHKVYHNAEGVPMVHFITTTDKDHLVTPQDALMYYDEFLSKYSRQPDGTVCYMGTPVK